MFSHKLKSSGVYGSYIYVYPSEQSLSTALRAGGHIFLFCHLVSKG